MSYHQLPFIESNTEQVPSAMESFDFKQLAEQLKSLREEQDIEVLYTTIRALSSQPSLLREAIQVTEKAQADSTWKAIYQLCKFLQKTTEVKAPKGKVVRPAGSVGSRNRFALEGEPSSISHDVLRTPRSEMKQPLYDRANVQKTEAYRERQESVSPARSKGSRKSSLSKPQRQLQHTYPQAAASDYNDEIPDDYDQLDD